MTALEKSRIARLRESGYSYQAIAHETGIPLSSIKMYFARRKPKSKDATCPQCHKPLGASLSPKRRFCSDKCRVKWWAAHPENLGNRDRHWHRCPVCRKEFFAYKPATFCSRACYYQSRRKGGTGHE